MHLNKSPLKNSEHDLKIWTPECENLLKEDNENQNSL